MIVLIQLLNVLLPLGYVLAVLNYLVIYVSRPEWSLRTVTPLARGLVAVHAVYLLLAALAFEHVPVASVWEAFTFIAFALAAVYLILEWRLRDPSTGVFLLTPVLFFQILSSTFVTRTQEVDPILQSSWFGAHVTTALLGYAAFAIAAVYGTLYLLLYRELKRKRTGLVFQRLPNLEVLARLNLNALIFGWGALTLAMLLGTAWAIGLQSRGELTGSFLLDPKFLSTAVVWVLYGSCLGGRYVRKWPSRDLAGVSLVTFLLMVASSIGINLFADSFHSFG